MKFSAAQHFTRDRVLCWCTLAILVVGSTSSLWASGGLPGFHHDWAWPISRPAASAWALDFVGQWSYKALGQPNLLPTQTYLVLFQAFLVCITTPVTALVLYLGLVEVVSFTGILNVLRDQGYESVGARLIPAVVYAASPVFFIRVQAGHLAYVLAYSLLPWIYVLSRRIIFGDRRAVLLLALIFALALSQIQFFGYGLVAVLAAAAEATADLAALRMIAASIFLGTALQLQGFLPLVLGGSYSLYEMSKPILSWQQNLSAPFSRAALMIGDSTQYYLQHAIAGAQIALWFLLALAFLGLFPLKKRTFIAFVLWLCGLLVTLGVYGPLGVPLSYLVQNVSATGVFRDFQYAGVLMAFGIALLLGATLERWRLLVIPCAVVAIAVAFPTISGLGLNQIIVHPETIAETNDAMSVVRSHGPGRVLWLPAEQPSAASGHRSAGQDIAVNGWPGNSSANQSREFGGLAVVIEQLRSGQVDVLTMRRLGIRYLVSRGDVVSVRNEAFGTSAQLSYRGLSDNAIAKMLKNSSVLRLISSPPSAYQVYEVRNAQEIFRKTRLVFNIRKFSELSVRDTTVLPEGASLLHLRASDATIDPRRDWVSEYAGIRFAPWLSDSIYPFVWTTSGRALDFDAPPGHLCMLIGAPSGATLQHGSELLPLRTAGWSKVDALLQAPTHFRLVGKDLVAISGYSALSCTEARSARSAVTLQASYDGGWRLLSVRDFRSPRLADGWAMAWYIDPSPREHDKLLYLPAIAQYAGFFVGLLSLGFAWRTLASRKTSGNAIEECSQQNRLLSQD